MPPVRSSGEPTPQPSTPSTGSTLDEGPVPLPPEVDDRVDPDDTAPDPQELAAQFEDERPGRQLSGPIGVLVTGTTSAIALLALRQVFDPMPQGSKFYLIIFLAGILPMVFLAYPADLRLPRRLRRTGADAPTIVVPNVLLVRKDLDAHVACAITRTVFDKKDALAQANPAAKGISLDNARKTDPVPLHRGAVKALQDLGAS
ncbi:TAXI family TRAP transporter solute-binding subunit [Micromonospora sp. C31]|uniref:TAXI family TRAP transporter solute-binding subunit n=1 Tax=Micromonospora sp. C31 TaxID=2824876 RepID=UPI0027DD6314|nr:TAXI family TRAP transporter solute-binding subunit [Micromonospora sp. C31]